MRVLNAHCLTEYYGAVAADITRITHGCPGLQQLTIAANLGFPDGLCELHHLTDLRQLEVCSISNRGVELLAESCPPSLRQLKLEGPHFNRAGVLSLTQLTHLTEMRLVNYPNASHTFACKVCISNDEGRVGGCLMHVQPRFLPARIMLLLAASSF
jgi:hypothetical protein